MSDISKNSIQIEAPVADVAALLFDPAGYPEWSTAIKSATVLEKDGEGRATKIEMMIKAGQVKDRVILDYDWSNAPAALTFSLDDADMLTQMSGGYTLTDNGDETTKVEYELTVALSMPVPAMMRTKAERDTIDLALKELKEKLEA
jgi:carbon monoxide dehydrogenase subunit G